MPTSESPADGSSADDASVPGHPHTPHPFHVVGVGASAGGLKALQLFFDAVPPDSGMVFVVIVHLDPDRESQLSRLLQNRSAIPVTQVTEPVTVEPNHAYIIPPTQNLSMVDGTIQLSDRDDRSRQAPIDLFFRTVAEVYGPSAIGVVLSGTGSDGASGIRRIKENGGITIAQDPEEAEFEGMPRSAIDTGQIDLVLPSGSIPAELRRLLADRPPISAPPAEQPGEDPELLLPRIFQRLREATGHDFSGYKRSTVLRRLDRRLRFNDVRLLSAYVELLQTDPSEVHALFQDLLISVSNFFRDPETFEVLRSRVIPELFEGKTAEDSVRVWVVGCATGEEAYSVAMLLHEEAARHPNPPEIQLFATDIDEQACLFAREGLYPETIAADVSEDRIEQFFDQDNGGYRVKKFLRKVVLFASHDLLKDPPFSRLDLISCRNVLIYLAADAQSHAAETFHYGLRPRGFLFLGTSESLGMNDLFKTLDSRNRIYRRVATARPVIPRFTGPGTHRPRTSQPPSDPEAGLPAQFSYGAVHVRLLEDYAPPSLVVDAEGSIVHLSDRAGLYLRLGGGKPSMNLIELTPEASRPELRAALHEALHDGMPSRRKLHLNLGNELRRVDVEIRARDEGGHGLALVIFQEIPAGGDLESVADPLPDSRTAELEEELLRTRRQLDSLLRTRDLSIEELQAANEELQSINEEHRATSEEMETSGEELQSINEELATINQEHRSTIEELKQVNADVRNLLEAIDIGTLFIDGQTRIRRFTPSLTTLFNLVPADQGRPIGHITHSLRYDTLAEDVEQVTTSLKTIDREIASNHGDWFSVRIHPYRSAEGKSDGAVLTFYDINARKQLEDDLRESTAVAQEANRVKSAFIATLSHELRTPLNGILGYADLLTLQGQLSGEQDRSAERIKAAVWHLDAMIEEILMLAKLDAGKESVRMERMDARVVANQAAEMLQQAMAAKGLAFELRVPEIRLEIVSDQGKLRQILVNLLGNALKYTAEGSIRLEVRLDRDRAVFSIRDTGIGIAPEHRDRVFERFWQVNDSLTRTAGGTGLGLAAAREFARLLGGDIGLDSDLGAGSVFTLWLPLEPVRGVT